MKYKRSSGPITNVASDGKQANSSIKEFIREEQTELNSNQHNGLQILPVLWGIEPSAIIDTTDLSPDQVASRADAILAQYGILPIQE